MSRQRAVGKSGAPNFSSSFRLILKYVYDATKIRRPDAEVSREDCDIRFRLEIFRRGEHFEAVDGEELPRKQRRQQPLMRCRSATDEFSHVIDAPASRRTGSGGSNMRIRERHRPPCGESLPDCRVTGFKK